MALPKANRLRHRRDFSTVYRSGIRCATPHLILRILRQRQAKPETSKLSQAELPTPTKIGISVSQKVSKRAVVRNRIKRQIRAAFRQLLPQLLGGLQIVVVVRPEAVQCDYHEFLRELEQSLINAEVVDGHSRGSLL